MYAYLFVGEIFSNDEKYLIQAFKSMADYGKIIDDQIIFHFVTPLMRNANQLKDYTCNPVSYTHLMERLLEQVERVVGALDKKNKKPQNYLNGERLYDCLLYTSRCV